MELKETLKCPGMNEGRSRVECQTSFIVIFLKVNTMSKDISQIITDEVTGIKFIPIPRTKIINVAPWED